jgi:hypothetical protein
LFIKASANTTRKEVQVSNVFKQHFSGGDMMQRVPHLGLYALTLLFLLTPLLLIGCAATQGSGGSFVNSRSVERIFESRTLLPDHNYYFTGSENDPDAILAVSKDIQFEKGLWSAIDLTQAKLNFWMIFIDDATGFWNCNWYGRSIVSPDGREVALYYSKYFYTRVFFPDPHTLVVYTPDDLTGNFGISPRHRNCWDDD